MQNKIKGHSVTGIWLKYEVIYHKYPRCDNIIKINRVTIPSIVMKYLNKSVRQTLKIKNIFVIGLKMIQLSIYCVTSQCDFCIICWPYNNVIILSGMFLCYLTYTHNQKNYIPLVVDFMIQNRAKGTLLTIVTIVSNIKLIKICKHHECII